MRTIINYFVSLFCRHEWLVEEDFKREACDGEVTRQGVKVYMRCKKCGWHRSHWKF